MQLSVSASYQPSEDEVWVDFRSTLDDMTTVTVADSVNFKLLIESTDTIGTVTYIPISGVQFDSSFVRPDQNYELKFRNPTRKMDLFIEVNAVYGMTTYQKMVSVGEALSSHNSIDLPDNEIYTRDVLNELLTGGGNGNTIANENLVVLSPDLADYVTPYDFTTPNPIEDYDGLVYLGGGNRLLIQNKTNQFELQTVDQAPWSLNGFLFLEPQNTNLIPNPFFITVAPTSNTFTGVIPLGYTVNGVGAMVQSTLSFNYQVSAAAKLWVLRMTQPKNFSYTQKLASVQVTDPVPVIAGVDYTFSTYTQVQTLVTGMNLTSLSLIIQWLDINAVPISTSNVALNPNDYSSMAVASLTAVAPVGAVNAQLSVQLGSVDAGYDLNWSFLGMQLESGLYPTSRMSGLRLQDEVTIDDYDAMNQQLRLQMVMGFQSGLVDVQLVQGPVDILFYATGLMEARIWGVAGVTSPVSFAPGDALDITVAHQAGKTLALYRDGQLLAETPLPDFTTPVGPLTILGVGVELLNLSVFSRRGD